MGDRDPQPNEMTLEFCYHLPSSLHSRGSAQMDFRTLQLPSGFSSLSKAASNIKGKRHGTHCHPVPTITTANLCRGSWHQDASALYFLFPATTEDCFNQDSWHWDASTLCCLFPATTAARFNRCSWYRNASALCCLFPATIAARFNRCSWHRDASALCCLFPATTATHFNRGSWHWVASTLRRDAWIFHLAAPSVIAAMLAGVLSPGMPAPILPPQQATTNFILSTAYHTEPQQNQTRASAFSCLSPSAPPASLSPKQVSSAPSVIFPAINSVDKKGRPVMHQGHCLI